MTLSGGGQVVAFQGLYHRHVSRRELIERAHREQKSELCPADSPQGTSSSAFTCGGRSS